MSTSAPVPQRNRLFARNTVLNLVGLGLPMAVALVTIPHVIAGLGAERFGILTVAWVVIGYFNLFDLGFGRALTKLVAERLGSRDEEVPALFWTAILLMFLLGVAGACALYFVTPWLVQGVLRIPPALQDEAVRSFHLLALSLPWVISTAGLLGTLEANQSFGLVNALRVPMGIFNYVAPLFVLPFSSSLVPVVVLLAASRIVSWAGHLAGCLHALPVLRGRIAIDWGRARALARFGGWMTVSNAVSPLMTNLDRFFIGSLISMAAVAYYVTPYELVVKLVVVPNALMAVLFPAFSATFLRDRTETAALFGRGFRAIFLALFPVTLVVITFAHEGMSLWLGEEFARQSSPVLRWLAAGVFVNCLAQVPFAFLQGVGRPDITGKLHLVELPLYAVAIWVLAGRFGIEGVAIAWLLRVSLDAAALFVTARRFIPSGRESFRNATLLVGGALASFVLGAAQGAIFGKVAFLTIALGCFGLVAWRHILVPSERAYVQRLRIVPTTR